MCYEVINIVWYKFKTVLNTIYRSLNTKVLFINIIIWLSRQVQQQAAVLSLKEMMHVRTL